MLVIRIEVNFRLEFKYKHIYSVLSLLSIKIRKLTRDVEADQRQKKQQSFQKLDVNDTIKRLSRSYIDKSKRKLFFIFSICRRQGKSVSAICISSSLTDNSKWNAFNLEQKFYPSPADTYFFAACLFKKKNKSDETRQNRV